tara:strand:- start:5912 stop:6112 length:201 start_codon:yes stop_codon:yes gene_type:complete
LEVVINIIEIERRVKVFIDYCDFIREECEEELEEELLEFVNDILTDVIVENSTLRKKLDEMQSMQD